MGIQKLAWENRVNIIKEQCSFKNEFDLINALRTLDLDTKKYDDFSKALYDLIACRKSDRKSMQSALTSAEKTLKNLKQISEISLDKHALQPEIAHQEMLIQKLSNGENALRTSVVMKKYPRSKSFGYIGKLLGIFHDGTGKMPECNSNREYEYHDEDFYHGNFYDFLIAIKPLLQEIDIQLPKNQTIGTYASRHLRGYSKRGRTYPPYASIFEYMAENFC